MGNNLIGAACDWRQPVLTSAGVGSGAACCWRRSRRVGQWRCKLRPLQRSGRVHGQRARPQSIKEGVAGRGAGGHLLLDGRGQLQGFGRTEDGEVVLAGRGGGRVGLGLT